MADGRRGRRRAPHYRAGPRADRRRPALTADTSAVIAALSDWQARHGAAARALVDVRALPAHAALEAYSVLTRLPGGLAMSPDGAVDLLGRQFPDAPLRIDADARASLLATLAAADVAGGAVYDGLVALEAAAHGQTLLTLDGRAAGTYRRLGVDFRIID